MKFILFALLLLHATFTIGQTHVEGQVKQESKAPLSGVSVVLKDTVTQQTLSYAITDQTGKYALSFSTTSQHLQLIVRSFGYETERRFVKNESQTIDFVLQPKAIALEEVTLNYAPITRKNDTISYDVKAFSQEQDRVIEDVLERLPGISVQENGQILYQGKPINKFYINNLDLLNGRYNLATQNLPFDKVEAVQVLENHQPIKALEGALFSGNAAINIELKESYTFTGQGNVALGASPALWKANFTPMLFTKNRQFLATYQTNNVGKDLSQQDQKLTSDKLKIISDGTLAEKEWLGLVGLGNPVIFTDKRWLDNTDHLLSVNAIESLGNDYFLRLNLSYLNTYKQHNGEIKTQYFTPTDTIALFEGMQNKLFGNAVKAQLNIEKNTTTNYFKNQFSFKGAWNSGRGAIQQATDMVNQNVQQDFSTWNNHFHMVLPIEDTRLAITSIVGYQHTPQELRVTPGQFTALVNNNLAYNELSQVLNLKHFKTRNSVGFSKPLGYFTLSPKVGFNLDTYRLTTHLNRDGIEKPGKAFHNDLNWLKTDAFASFNTSFIKGKWRMYLKLPFHLYSFTEKKALLETKQNSTQFVVEPSLTINYTLNRNWKALINAKRSQSFGDISQLYSGYILRNYRSINRYDAPLPKSTTDGLSGELIYENLLSMFGGNLSYSYGEITRNSLLTTHIQPDGSIQFEAIAHKNTAHQHILMGELWKRLLSLNTYLKLQFNYNQQSLQQRINSVYYDTKIDNWSLGFHIDTKFTSWFDLAYDGNFSRSAQQLEQHAASQHSSLQTHQLELHFEPIKNHNLIITTEYVNNKLISSRTENTFMDITYQYVWKQMDFEISARNIFNNAYYTKVRVSNYALQQTQYRLRPFQVLVGVRFSL